MRSSSGPRARLVVAGLLAAIVVAGAFGACVVDGGVLTAVPDGGGAADGGSTDAGLADAGVADAGVADAGVADAGIIDEAGGAAAPLDVTLPLALPIALDPAGDVDCVRFTLAERTFVHVRVATAGAVDAACDGAHDSELSFDPPSGPANDDESGTSRCPRIDVVADPGAHVACVDYYLAQFPIALTGLEVDITTEPPPVCGDGILGFQEDCDDGNVVGGDGCSPTCTAEAGFVCPGVAGPCRPIVPVTPSDTCTGTPPRIAFPSAPGATTSSSVTVDPSFADDEQPVCNSTGGTSSDGFVSFRASFATTLTISFESADPNRFIIPFLSVSDPPCSDPPIVCAQDQFQLDVVAGHTYTVAVDYLDQFEAGNPVRIDLTAAPVVLTIASVVPDNGLATATSEVTVNGAGFQPGAVAVFAGVTAACTVQAAALSCTVPASGGALRGDVVVTNPDGQSATVANGWTFTGVLNETGVAGEADFCVNQFPTSITTSAATLFFGQIFEAGLTDTNSTAAPGIRADFGLSPVNATGVDVDPTQSTSWTFTPAVANPGFDFQQNNDEYEVDFTPSASGTFFFDWRFSFDDGLNYTYCDDDGAGSNGGLDFSSAQNGTLTVP